MVKLVSLAVLLAVLLLAPPASRADLFEDSLSALTNDNLNAAALDHFGRSLRGGLSSAYPQINPPANPLLHDFNINTPCGAFSFGSGVLGNLAGMMDPQRIGNAFVSQVQGAVMAVIGAAISQLPMVTACYLSPTVCDVVKQIQDVINEILHGKLLSCSQAETLLSGMGMKLSGQRTSACISQMQAGGMLLAEAEQACATSSDGLFDPATGGASSRAELIAGSLERVNADPDIRDFASQVLGEVVLEASGGPLDIDIEAPTRRLHDVYEQERADIFGRLVSVVPIVGSGSQPSAQDHREISLPGLAMPFGVLRGLARIQASDPAAARDYMGKLANSMAMVRLSWRVGELRDQLEEGMQNNSRLSDAEIDVIKGKLGRLMIERDRLIAEKELAERHVLPVMQAVLRDDQARREMAATLAVGAGADMNLPDNRFGRQNAMGYGY